jgi:hypothetical protein
MTSLDQVIEFLEIAEKKGNFNTNTAQSRRTACSKIFSVLDDDQRTVEYVRDNLDVIKARFQNLNKEVSGQTVEIYISRVRLSLDDFAQWGADRAQWERDSASKATRSASTEKKVPPKKTAERNGAAEAPADDMRTVKFPLNAGGDVSVSFPRDALTSADIRRLAWGLAAYATDSNFESSSVRSPFPVLDAGGEVARQ